MSQKVQIYKNNNRNSQAFGKYYVRPVYDKKFITTEDLADFIQDQATVKRSDCKAVLDELGSAFKHFFEMGQKIKLDNIGIFKVGVTSSPSDTIDGCTAANVKNCHVIFVPQTEAVASGETAEVKRGGIVDGQAVIVAYRTKVFNHPATMLKDVRFELAQDSQAPDIVD